MNYNFKDKRFTTWTDDTSWTKTAVSSGLRYGVYDNVLGKSISYSLQEKYGIITTLERAREVAMELNNEAIQVEKGFICRCNNCMAILIDGNPLGNAVKQELKGTELEMVRTKDELLDEMFWACPNCLTDDYLTDEWID